MMSFKKYVEMRVLSEETKEEREMRERVAAERKKAWDSYSASHREHMKMRPKSPFSSPEWLDFVKRAPKNPLDEFREETYQELERITGLDWRHCQIIPDAMNNSKQDADCDRIESLIVDSYDDGSSPQEAAAGAVEILRSMGYLKR